MEVDAIQTQRLDSLCGVAAPEPLGSTQPVSVAPAQCTVAVAAGAQETQQPLVPQPTHLVMAELQEGLRPAAAVQLARPLLLDRGPLAPPVQQAESEPAHPDSSEAPEEELAGQLLLALTFLAPAVQAVQEASLEVEAEPAALRW